MSGGSLAAAAPTSPRGTLASLRRFGRVVLREAFDFERPETRGQRVYVFAFEAFVACFAARFAWQWASYIPRLQSVVLPLGVASWLDPSFMFNAWAPRANAALLTLACGVGLLTRFRWAYLVALACFHLQYVSRYCLGEISHGSNLVGTAIVGLALGGVWFRDDRLSSRRFGLGFTVLLTGIGYSSAGLCKLVATGPLWVDGRHLTLWITERSIDGYGKFGVLQVNWLQQLLLDRPIFSWAILTFGLLAELLAFAGIWRRLRPWAFGAVIGMHFGIWLSMGILFDANLYLLLILAFPWDRAFDRVWSAFSPAPVDPGRFPSAAPANRTLAETPTAKRLAARRELPAAAPVPSRTEPSAPR